MKARGHLSKRLSRGFTLLELLIAVSVFAIVLAAMNTVFYTALRLRNRAAELADKNVPVEHALAIIKRDLSNLVPPGGALAGPLQTASTTNAMTAAGGPVFFTTSGALDETSPWAEVQKVSYTLIDSTNRFQGKDLVRLAGRNLLASSPEPPFPQLVLREVQTIAFAFYDGSQWRDYWDSATEAAPLPAGIRVQIQRAAPWDDVNAPLPPLLELVVPVMVSAPTNSTDQASGGAQ